ncbi:hypothetical protein P0136_06565 [Lentisphaerota bacterium ZTH]|nr:hypothetical protein JYG24_02325 [Lentisphaerota bacterium]WET07652.1 hypothetical protein P0136_06565 [Lentisphaerota bacterium ZTH]
MNDFTIYKLVLLLAAVLSGGIVWFILRLKSDNITRWEALPRNRYAGVVLGFLCLLWCIPQAKPIVWTWMLSWLFPLAVVFSVIGFFFLDYLFARAVGGFFILTAYYMVHESFTYHTAHGAVFAVMCWTLGIAGLFFSGKPYLLRDILRKIAVSRKYKYVTAAFFAAFGLFCFSAGIIHLAAGTAA